MRPALDGHAGIPQATRLLFRGLSKIDGFEVEGLIQSSEHALAKGLPVRGGFRQRPLSKDQQFDRQARVVITLEQKLEKSQNWLATRMSLRHLVGGTEELTRFEARHFQDYIWRRLFARTLPPEDFDIVAGARFRIARAPWKLMHYWALAIRKHGYTLYPRLDTSDFDVMIAETPYPATVSKNTQLVIRYHDAIPMLMPHTIAERHLHQASHYRALRRNVATGAWFVCVSEATRNDLLSIFPQVEARSLTIHNMVSHHYFDEQSSASQVPEIIKIRLNTKVELPLDPALKRALFESDTLREPLQYLLMVSTIEPRKNHLTLLSAWERLRVEGLPQLKLLIVGALGWHHESFVDKFRPWMERGGVFLLEEIPSEELRLLYKHARATICPSFGEGFDFSGVEAMKSGGAVVASDIAVHREVYSDAAEFFNPYSVDDLRRAIQEVIDPAKLARRDELIAKGKIVSQRYSNEVILPKWQSFLRTTLLAAK